MPIAEVQTLDLFARFQQIEEERAKIVKQMDAQICDQYGEYFVNLIGLENIRKIPVVKAQEVGLDNPEKDLCIDLSKVQFPVCRGLDGANRPFIIMKADYFVMKKTVQIALMVFKRYSIDYNGKKDGYYGNNYVTSLRNVGSDGEIYYTPHKIYSGGGMSTKQIAQIRDLLEGKRVDVRDQRTIMHGEDWFIEKSVS